MSSNPFEDFRSIDAVVDCAAGLAIACGVSPDRISLRLGERAVDAAMRSRPTSYAAVFEPIVRLSRPGFRRSGRDVELFDELREINAASPLQAGFSTISNAFGTVGNLLVEEAFDASFGVASAIAATRTVRDFRPFVLYRMSQQGTFEKQAPGKQPFSSASLVAEGRASDVNQVETRGVTMEIGRQQLINDQVGAFAAAMRDMGRRAAIAMERALFAEACMESSDDFYSAVNANRATSSALSASTLGAVEALLWKQKVGTMPAGARPFALLVPPELSHTARALLQNQAAGSNNTLRVLVSPFLSDTTMPGASATTWFVVGDPAALPAFVIAGLGSGVAPKVDTAPLVADQLGVAITCYADFGIARGNHRAAAKATA